MYLGVARLKTGCIPYEPRMVRARVDLLIRAVKPNNSRCQNKLGMKTQAILEHISPRLAAVKINRQQHSHEGVRFFAQKIETMTNELLRFSVEGRVRDDRVNKRRQFLDLQKVGAGIAVVSNKIG